MNILRFYIQIAFFKLTLANFLTFKQKVKIIFYIFYYAPVDSHSLLNIEDSYVHKSLLT
jgi:hypothetical protein